MYKDEHDLIVQSNGDGGDTAQREGMFACAVESIDRTGKWYSRVRYVLNVLELKPGYFARHPKQEPHCQINRLSRDNNDPLIILMGEAGDIVRLERHYKEHKRRWFRYQNLTDYPQLHTPSMWIRARRDASKKWLLPLFDIGLLIASVAKVLSKRVNPDHVDDNNHIMRLIQAARVMDTCVARFARFVYRRFRPRNLGNTIGGEECPIMGALVHYHRAEAGGNPEVAEAYRPLIKKYFY